MRSLAVALLAALVLSAWSFAQSSSRKMLVAHRGASAYAPEHTLASYRLALEQGADFVEQDLGITKDGVLVCAHDPTLVRTTSVEDIFPDRFRESNGRRQWFIADFTLDEIKRLDAGGWFDVRFAGERVPTFDEAIDLVRGKAGLFPELKAPGVYRDRGVDMAPLVATALRARGLDQKGADARTAVILQSFDVQALRSVGRELPSLDRTFLLEPGDAPEWTTDAALRTIATFATGIGPSKIIVDRDPDLVSRAHALGLTVIPYTFRASNPGQFPSVRAEMQHFLSSLGVDGVFTDNPDQFPR